MLLAAWQASELYVTVFKQLPACVIQYGLVLAVSDAKAQQYSKQCLCLACSTELSVVAQQACPMHGMLTATTKELHFFFLQKMQMHCPVCEQGKRTCR